jgi:PleD family two-component response regulator
MPTHLLKTRVPVCCSLISRRSSLQECVSILTRPVRINAFYAALLSLVANQKPVSPFTASTVGSTASLPAGPTLKICIAEDNPVNQQVLIKLLKALGYTDVRTAATGVKLLKLLHEAPADVVLMDVQMPEMDGLTATTRIRVSSAKVRLNPVLTLARLSPGFLTLGFKQDVTLKQTVASPVTTG